MSTLEDEIEERKNALMELDSGEEYEDELVGEVDDAEQEVFGEEDIDRADRMARGTGDSLAQKSMLRQDKWSDLNEIADFTRIVPASVLQGTIGGQQQVQGNANQQLANWAGDDAETVPITVTFAPVQQIGTVTTPAGLRPYGIIQFGTRGFSVKAEVDIGTGVQFTVSGSAMTLQAALDTSDAVKPASMLIAGMLSFYPVVRTAPLYRTKYIDDLSVATDIVVPPFAKNVVIWRETPAATAITLEFFTSVTGGSAIYSYTLAAGAFQLDPVPLAGDITKIRVTRTAGAGALARCIFELSL